jgi:hypothetical protein
VVNLWHYVSFVAEWLDEFPEGPSLVLDDAGLVLIDSQTRVTRARGVEVTSEQLLMLIKC